MRHSFCLVLSFLFWPNFMKAHELNMNEKVRIEALISAEHPSRIQVVGDRIANIFIPDGLSVETDEETGQAFILPLSAEKNKEFTITLTTESGLTQDLMLKTTESKGEVIRLIARAHQNKSNPYHGQHLNKIHEIVRTIAKGDAPDGFHATNASEIKEIWPGIQCRMLSAYAGEGLTIQIIELTNFSETPRSFNEMDFIFGPEIMAVALEEYTLNPSFRTKAIIVRKADV
ncbi:MAG: type-F conjugative transfer system secretin TraK [Holosporales bacterium]